MEEKKYSAAEMERILKIQEVIAKAMAGKLTWWEAAEIMGVTDRTMRRVQRVLSLYQEKYSDFNVRHFHEKLIGEYGIDLSNESAMSACDKFRNNGPIFQPRPISPAKVEGLPWARCALRKL